MIKKLDKLVLKAFIGPFAATFFITLVVLVLQFFWLWIDDFVGKGIGPDVILKFIGYQAATLVPLALPLAVLLASLMTFGNLGETYEIVAVKSAGISLLRFMRPLFVFVLGVSGIAFYFANSVIPITQLKSRSMLTDIVYAKPAFDIKEGVFYDKINGLAIKVGKKEGDSIIKDIIIYEQAAGLQDNFVIASDGIMKVGADKRFLEFNLKNGWRYQERAAQGSAGSEFIRLGFKEYKKKIDLIAFQFKQTSSDSSDRANFRIMSMPQLAKVIDSMDRRNRKVGSRIRSEAFATTGINRWIDSSWKRFPAATAPIDLEKVVPDSVRALVNDRMIGRIGTIRSTNDAIATQLENDEREKRKYQIEWHRKLTLPVACIVLFLIGAPLGSIIRRGGIGNSLIASIIFFMLFYFIANTGEKLGREAKWSVFSGMWLATFILLPIGIFLTYKALHDSQLFNRESYHRAFRKIFPKKKAIK